eukprot:SAG31_NODE_26173_length_447_cov_0.632184_1_plen_81_part_01
MLILAICRPVCVHFAQLAAEAFAQSAAPKKDVLSRMYSGNTEVEALRWDISHGRVRFVNEKRTRMDRQIGTFEEAQQAKFM